MAQNDDMLWQQDDIYTDEFIRKLPAKKIVLQTAVTDEDDSEIKEEKSQSKKGFGGLKDLIKTENQNSVQLATKYNIFLDTIKNTNEPFELVLELPNESTVDDCILQSAQLFNQKIKEQNLPMQQLSKNIEDFCLYNANKKGEKKEDLPALEGSQVLQKTHIYRFVLVPIKQQLIPKVQQAGSYYLDFQKFEKNSEKNESSAQKQNEPEKQIEEFSTCCFCFKIKKKK